MSRRSVLRGLGATVFLPFMPSLAWAQGLGDKKHAPRRFVSLVCGDGMHPEGWWAEAAGGGLKLGPTLEPFAPFASKLAVIKNLNHKRKMARVHGYGFTTFLTCTYAPSGEIKADISLDQLLAQTYGRDTPIPSLVYGVEKLRPGLVNGAPAIYQATCSWSTPTTPVAPEINPQQAFDRLFDVSSLKNDRSILDYVQGSAQRVSRMVSADDRDKLDQYLTSVREIEKRIAAASTERPADAWQPSLKNPSLPRPGDVIPSDPTEHMRLMLDLVALALQMDKSRVANFILEQDFSDKNYGFVEGVSNSTGHVISHHQDRAELLAEYKRVNRYLAGEVAYLAAKLDSVKESPDGTTLLDNTLLFFGSCMMDGNTHTRDELPILLLGGKGTGLRYGLHDYGTAGEQSLGRLHVSIAQNLGLDVDRVGDQEEPLPGLFGA